MENVMSHVLHCQYTEWEPANFAGGHWNFHHDVTKNKVMAFVNSFFKVRHMYDKYNEDVRCIENCLNAALNENARNQIWFAAVVGDYSVILQRTSDGIYFVYGWAEDFDKVFNECWHWIS